MAFAHAPSRRVRIALAGFLGASLAAGAAIVACGPGDLSDLTRGRRDSGAEAGGDVVAPVCNHASAPERPLTDDAPSIPDILFAAEDLRLDTGELDAGLPKAESLDLDRTCSCAEPPSCVPPPEAGAPTCDGPDGRDNVCGALLGTVAVVVPFLDPSVISERIRKGASSILLSVQKWNGQPNDPEVVVTVRMAVGVEGRPDGDGGVSSEPQHDGNDVWEVDPGSIVGGDTLIGQDCSAVGCIGLGSDFKAYVRDGVLVANFESIPFSVTVPKGRLLFPFIGAILTARITEENGRHRIAGEIAGRWKAESILSGFYAFHDPVTGVPLCKSPDTYAYFKRGICSSADLAASPAQDRTGAPCSALSESVRFVGSPAKIGHVRAATQEPPDCPEFQDSCP